MKLTAKLAYSQLKINRTRTFWAQAAIALSTALTTAVSSFAASGNALLVELLGENYGVYAASYKAMLFIPAVIFGIMIIAMSVTVISNVFRISAQERIMEFGILKCTGAGEKQITETVMYESILLCTTGIPIGIVLGLLLALGGIGTANHLLEDLNALAHIMINKFDLSVSFVFSWQAVLLSGIFSFVTVLFSAWLPAHKAARIPAADCIRGAGQIKVTGSRTGTNPLVDKLFGFEGTLAAKNMKRSRRNFRAAIISLSVGVTLFISLGGLGSQAGAIEDYMSPDTDNTVVTDYVTNFKKTVNKATGREETVYTRPIDNEWGGIVTQRLEEFGDINIFGIGSDWDTYYTEIPKELVSPNMLEALEYEGNQEVELEAELIILDEENYAELCEKAGVPIHSTILLNHYSYNNFGREVNLEPFSPAISEITLLKADGSSETVAVQGILTREEIPGELFYPNTNPVRLIVPNTQVREYSWQCAPSEPDAFIEYSNKVLKDVFPTAGNSSYMEEGFSARVYKIDDYIKVMNIAIVLAAVFMYSFVALLMLIGLTNVISTISTNVMMRSREFAVLKSVGMTPESLKRMLNYESILCSVKALLYGIPVGIGVTFLISLPIRLMFPIPYKFPWISVVLSISAVFLITWGINSYASHKLRNQNLIETIRSERGR